MNIPPYESVRRFGLIAPSANTVLEPELYGLRIPGVSFHFARVRSERGSDEAILRRMANEVPLAAESLRDVRPEMIVYACTSGSLVGGAGFDRQIAESITERTSVPATTTATAVVGALRAVTASRIGVGTPYLEWVTRAEVEFFEAAGHTVVATASLGLVDGHAMAALAPEEVRNLARRVDDPDADAIFLSCTDLPSLSVLAHLEDELGKPVISSNSATLWALIGPSGGLAALGRLFQSVREGHN